MQNRQDQLQAHQYSMQRVVAALVTHDPDPARSPLSRSGRAALAGVLVAGLIAAGVGIHALVTGQSGITTLRDDAAIFVEDTGALFVYYQPDGKLHPVLNFPSAQLIAGSPHAPARAVKVKRGRLDALQQKAKIQVGAPLGIPDAPASLPLPDDLVRDPWLVCSESASGNSRPLSRIRIGGGASAGHTLAVEAAEKPSEALLVVDPAGNQFLIHANHRFQLRKPAAALAAFGWNGRQATQVAAAWINVIPAGGDLQPLRLERLGQPADVLGKRVGQLYQAPGPDNTLRWAVLARDGIVAITEVQARLLDADPDTTIGVPITLTAAEFSQLPASKSAPAVTSGQSLLPAGVPNLLTVTRSVCATVGDAVSAVSVDPAANAGAGDITAQSTGARRGGRIDSVDVPLGRGVLVEAMPSPTAPAGTGTISIVTAAGIRHAIADRDAMAMLGFGQTTPVRLPSEVVAAVPEGPPLGIAAARKVQQ